MTEEQLNLTVRRGAVSSPEPLAAPQDEKLQNGKGVKQWRYDLTAGLQVALMGRPLSLSIALDSGAPPVTGVTSAINAGLVFALLGGAYITIGGPAASLAPALLVGMLTLGQGNLAAGYPLSSGHDFLDRHMKAGHTCVILGTQHVLSRSDRWPAYRVNQSDDTMAYG